MATRDVKHETNSGVFAKPVTQDLLQSTEGAEGSV